MLKEVDAARFFRRGKRPGERILQGIHPGTGTSYPSTEKDTGSWIDDNL